MPDRALSIIALRLSVLRMWKEWQRSEKSAVESG